MFILTSRKLRLSDAKPLGRETQWHFPTTVLFSYRQDNSANTMTFFLVLITRAMYESITKNQEKIFMADFFYMPFFSKVLV